MLHRVSLCQRCFVASEEAAVAFVDERVDGNGLPLHIDSIGSVSALIEIENDFAYDPAHIELNRMGDPHGS